MLTYKTDIIQRLKEAGYNTSRIRKEKLISENALQQIREGEMVAIKTLTKLCELLDAQPGDLIGYDNGNDKIRKTITLDVEFDRNFTQPLFFDNDEQNSVCKGCPFYFSEEECSPCCVCPSINEDGKCPIRKYFD